MSAANQTKGRVLLTGINGFIAIHITKILLERGYSVVGTVRSQSRIPYIKGIFTQATEEGTLDFAIVKDITQSGAFDEVLQSWQFDAVLHTSSPFVLEADDPEKELLQPAIKGTTGILQSIHKFAPSVQRVVVVSSFASIIDIDKGLWPGHVYTDDEWNPITYEKGCQNGVLGYYASKKLAEQAAWEFMHDQNPQFTLTTLCPPMVYGSPEQEISSLSKLNTSAALMYNIFDGKVEPDETGVWLWVDVRDIALAHIRAIETDEAANQRYLVTAGTYSPQQFVDFIWRTYPEHARARGVSRGTPGKLFPEGGVYTADNGKSRRQLGLEYHGLDDMMKQTFDRFLQLEAEGK